LETEILESYSDEKTPEGVVKVASVAVSNICAIQVSYRRSKMITSMEDLSSRKKGSTKQLASELRG
jgi:hypothetical protein